MHDATPLARLDRHLSRHLAQAPFRLRLDEALGTQHGLSWADFVLLAVLDDAVDALSTPALAARLGVTPSRLVLQLLPLEKTGLVAREAGAGGHRRVALRPGGRRLVHEARDTAAVVCAEEEGSRDAMRSS
jgi:DNA-binding MarR family transcriptional regulator